MDKPTRPPCDNCGEGSKYIGHHGEAGQVYACGDCVVGQDFWHSELLDARDERLRKIIEKEVQS
jgi:ribosomal protein S27AE